MAKFNIKVVFVLNQKTLARLLKNNATDLSRAVSVQTLSTDSERQAINLVNRFRLRDRVAEIFVNGESVYKKR